MSAQPLPSITIASPNLPKVAWGKGIYVYDTQGNRYIDGSSGPAVYCLGHGNEEVNEAIKAQLDRIAHGYRYTFTSDPLEDLTSLVAEVSGMEKAVFVTGGSEAVESCLKIALQYHAARGDMKRRRFIARERSWHGNTLGALSVSGFLERKAPFEGALLPVSRIGPANAYRPPENVAPENTGEACARELEEEILKVGAENVAAFIFEPVVGAAGGCVPAPPGYAKRVREICDRHGILMIADEVMCGAGRCGTWRALEHDGVMPDIMSVAKGLGGGYIPLGAALYTRRVAEPILAVHGGVMTGHTFTGHTTACAAGVAVQIIVRRERLVERVKALEPVLRRRLREATAEIEEVGDIRGRGFFIGLELVSDPLTKAPFPADRRLYIRVRDIAFANGLICYPSGGNVDGVNGDVVIVSPPYITDEDQIGEIAAILGRSIKQAVHEARTG
jgi:adenosylmethionine-8-amino-7-oxononanoate aminotransferase